MEHEPQNYPLQHFFPLSDAEIACRQFWTDHPDKRRMDSIEMRTFLKDTIRLPIEVHIGNVEEYVLNEDQFIPASYNIMAIRHLRYLPGCFHSHDFFEINCVISGSCEYQMPEKGELIQEGDVVVFPPHKPHLIDVSSDDCILINILARSSTFDRYFFSLFNSYDILTDFWTQALYGKQESAYLLFHCGRETKIRECVLRILQQAETKQAYQSQMLDALFHVFLITLLQDHEQDVVISNPENQRDDRNIVRIINFISEKYKFLTLSQLAGEFHYSERQMARILKEYTGTSFGDFIRDIKLKRAVDLLQKSSLSIQSIVEAVGYSDLSHFYRVFKKEYGCTPIEYRTKK